MTTNIWGLILNVVPIHVMKAYRRRSGIAPLVPNLNTTWRSVANFTSQLLYSQWKKPSEVGGPQSQPGHLEKEKHLDIAEDQTSDHPDYRLVTAVTMQLHLLRPDNSTWQIWKVISDVTWHLCHSTYISPNETGQIIGHIMLNTGW